PICKLHVAVPILLGDKGTEQKLVNTDSDYQVSNDSYIEENKLLDRQTKVLKNKYLDKEEQR
ncbi:32336_t:CDS:1, partial [Gigaspora margarita]